MGRQAATLSPATLASPATISPIGIRSSRLLRHFGRIKRMRRKLTGVLAEVRAMRIAAGRKYPFVEL
jgi:hypothetical protein